MIRMRSGRWAAINQSSIKNGSERLQPTIYAKAMCVRMSISGAAGPAKSLTHDLFDNARLWFNFGRRRGARVQAASVALSESRAVRHVCRASAM
jgi:hypothetical protein